jgi:peptidoglycan hydrolase CwlO-like protein
MPKEEEILDFKVIEFSKENKKIIVSHAKIYEDQFAVAKAKEESEKNAEEMTTQKAVKRLKDNMEKATLGDLGVLATLKEEMLEGEKAKLEKMAEKAEKKAKPAAKPKKATKKEEPAPEPSTTDEATPNAEEPVQETPVVEEPAQEIPVAEEPAPEVPIAEEPAPETPNSDTAPSEEV